MIPLWLTTICSIILLAVILYNLITSDINWKLLQSTIKSFAEISDHTLSGYSVEVGSDFKPKDAAKI